MRSGSGPPQAVAYGGTVVACVWINAHHRVEYKGEYHVYFSPRVFPAPPIISEAPPRCLKRLWGVCFMASETSSVFWPTARTCHQSWMPYGAFCRPAFAALLHRVPPSAQLITAEIYPLYVNLKSITTISSLPSPPHRYRLWVNLDMNQKNEIYF